MTTIGQAARRELVSQLGLEPGAGLRLLHQQILTADPALDLDSQPASRGAVVDRAPALVSPSPAADGGAGPVRVASRGPVPRQVPAAVACFVGRERELRALAGLLDRAARPGATAIYVITGGAGIGA